MHPSRPSDQRGRERTVQSNKRRLEGRGRNRAEQRIPAARKRPSNAWTLPLQKRGRRESRASDAPAASYAKVKSIRASHHRFTGSDPAFPAQWFYGFLRARPGDRAFLASVARAMR
jgi:hypothetical protein